MNGVTDILESIGNTPLIKLRKVTEGLQREIYVKCEYLNPSGSIKDRIALRMIGEAERGETKTRWHNHRTDNWEHGARFGLCRRCERIQGSFDHPSPIVE
ncbi:MAG: pyridoxal-phosphate dependent enzyme [Candidatus Bathyarchaeota archaeon]|nr:MAG: pyridoxal-phosphate dependent enzyme [Candidatus Bathyarchaeota archaeon]